MGLSGFALRTVGASTFAGVVRLKCMLAPVTPCEVASLLPST